MSGLFREGSGDRGRHWDGMFLHRHRRIQPAGGGGDLRHEPPTGWNPSACRAGSLLVATLAEEGSNHGHPQEGGGGAEAPVVVGIVA